MSGARTVTPPGRELRVSAADAAQFDFIVRLMTHCFIDDPVCRHLYPSTAQYLAHFPDYVRIYAERGVTRGGAHLCGDVGAALWLPPGVHPDDAALDALLDRSVAPDARAELVEAYAAFDRAHPTEPHWFLPLMGVDPFMKRRGVGAALLRYGLDACDRDGAPAYLESTKPENVAFYESFGFRRHGLIDVGRHPKVVTMIRPPQAQDA